MLFSIVVPFVPEHDEYFLDLIISLSQNPYQIGEIIASRSSATESNAHKFDIRLNEVTSENSVLFPVKVLHTEAKLSAGENRNRAWEIAKFEYVVFCDADDSYSPFRLRMFEDAIKLHSPDLLVHDYFSGERFVDYSYQEPSNLEYVLTPDIFEATFINHPRNRASEGQAAGDTNIRVPFKLNNHVKIHHAHCCVRNSIREEIQFGLTSRAEDGQFCRDILHRNYKAVYIPWELSTWIYSRSTAPKSRLQATRKILNRLKQSFTP